MIGLLAMFLSIGALAWSIGAIAADRLSSSAFETQCPGWRLRRLGLMAMLPWLLPASWIAALAGVALGKRGGWIDDHCRLHGDGHPHLCFEHFPAVGIEPLAGALLLAIVSALALVVLRRAWLGLRARRRLAGLLRLMPAHGLLRRIDDERPMAFVARPLRPVLLVSEGLRAHLDPCERRVVIAHETAHLRHRDLVKTALFEWLLVLHWPTAATRLRAQWHQAVEERADDRVARRFGRTATAEALLKVVRAQKMAGHAALGAGGADPARRIERLLETDPRPQASPNWGSVALGLLVVASATYMANAHHAVETLLGSILRH